MAQKKKSLADRIQASQKPKMTAAAQEQALKKLQDKSKAPEKKKNVRVSVDFPQEIYEAMKEVAEMRGQSHRGFIISLVRDHLSKANI